VYEFEVNEEGLVATKVPPVLLLTVLLYQVYPVTVPVLTDTLTVSGATVALLQAFTVIADG
jgi:hypothetical protein